MEKQKEIKNDYNFLKNEIERNLYCIKRNNFIMNEEFEKEYGFNFKMINNITNTIFLKEKYYNIEKQSRIIEFIIDGNSQKRFIYSFYYLQQVFNELNIEYYSTTNENLNVDDSIDSEVCLDEIINIFNNEEINKIYKIKLSKEKIIEIFNNRYPKNEIKLVSDLLINTKFYYNNNSEDILDKEILMKYYEDIKKFMLSSDNNILYLIGPKGTSKSLFLNFSLLMFNMSYQIPSLYINYIKIKNLELKKRKNIFKKEIIYLFFDEKNLKDFYKEKYHRIIISDKNNFIKCLKEFFETLMNIYKNTFNRSIILIIDNFDENEKLIYDEMEDIIKLVNENSSKVKLIISGHSNFINNKLMLFIENNSFLKKNKENILLNYNIKIDTENEIKTLPAFYFRKDLKNLDDTQIEKILLSEEITYCEKFNILGMYYSILNCRKKIEIKNIINFFNLLPIEYLNFEMEKDYITFNFHNSIFYKAVKKKIHIKIKETSLLFLLKECNNDQIIKGIFEEKLLTLAISYNKIGLKNLTFCENNKLEIFEITSFKDINIKNENNKIKNGEPIIINQENFKGPYYDLLILFPIATINTYKYISYFIQIGVNKIKTQFEKIINDFEINKNNYIKGINNFIGNNNINIIQAELLFIFDKDTQQNLFKAKSNNFGAEYCIKNKIKFYLFSIEDYCLYITFNIISFNKVYEFGNFDKFYKRNWNMIENQKFYFLTCEEINFLNLKTNTNIIKTYDHSINNIKGVPQKRDNEKIYILKNESKNYYIINNLMYYSYNRENFDEINEEDIIKDEEFN